jgi:hypothetical protein
LAEQRRAKGGCACREEQSRETWHIAEDANTSIAVFQLQLHSFLISQNSELMQVYNVDMRPRGGGVHDADLPFASPGRLTRRRSGGVGGCLVRQRGVSNLHKMNERRPIGNVTAKAMRWLFKCYASSRCLKPSLCRGRWVARCLVACCTL